MRIGIDATPLPPVVGGAGEYMLKLIASLSCIDDTNEYYIFIKSRDLHYLTTQKHNIHPVLCASNIRPLRLLWEQTILPLHVARLNLDLLHSLHYTCPLFARGVRHVITFHDMTFFLLAEKHSLIKRIYFRKIVPIAARRAEVIVADSHSTKRDIMNVLDVREDKIKVVYLGVDPVFSEPVTREEVDRVLGKYVFSRGYILYVGAIEPWKNIGALVQAFARIKERHEDITLLLVGLPGLGYAEVSTLISRLGLRENVFHLGYVPREDLPALYRGAGLFIYPSIYEGFGLPVLEAMASGVPVVTSKGTAMEEIAGGAAMLCDPRNPEDIVRAIETVICDDRLREKLIAQGRNNAANFSWERAAGCMQKIYERVSG